MHVRALVVVALMTACTVVRGSVCQTDADCAVPYVCATTSSPGMRRCLLPCAVTIDGGVALGGLCADGSICMDSDHGPICYFQGSIPYGAACPMAGCDPAVRVCDCEPGTRCTRGICRQACPDVRACSPGEACRAGTCETVCANSAACAGGVCAGGFCQ